MDQEEKLRYFSIQDIIIASQGGPETYPAHWHNAAEFTLALRDGCSYRVQNTVYELRQGDLLLVWPHDLHETISAPAGAAAFIQFSDRLLDSNLDLSVARRSMNRLRVVSRRSEPELAAQLASLFTAVRENYDDGQPFSETRCKILIYQMLLLIGSHIFQTKKRQSEGDPLSVENWERMREACAFIEAHYADEIPQEQVAAAVGLSPWYFSRLFRRYANCSFPQYISHVRVRAAAKLLGQTSLSVTECAWQAGFQSITTFNKCFMEEMGIAPRDYRKKHLI